jgi:hypothetical protein
MWIFFAVFAAALVATFALAPKPKGQPSPLLEDVQFPQAEVGLEIPVLFGCRDMRAPNVLWYGDLRTTAIKSKGGKK